MTGWHLACRSPPAGRTCGLPAGVGGEHGRRPELPWGWRRRL